jgi:hypothetical protein
MAHAHPTPDQEAPEEPALGDGLAQAQAPALLQLDHFFNLNLRKTKYSINIK